MKQHYWGERERLLTRVYGMTLQAKVCRVKLNKGVCLHGRHVTKILTTFWVFAYK